MQHYANVVLDYVSRVEKHKQDIRELKLALVTAHILEPFTAFPELDPGDTDEAVPEGTDERGEAIQTTYIFSEALEDSESIEDELRSLLAQSAQGTASFTDSEDWL